MAESTGIILAAAGIAVANEIVFAPIASSGRPALESFNWRIIPVTAVAGLALAGLESLSKPFGKGLAMLALVTVLVMPVGNAASPIDNVSKMLRLKT